MKNCPNCGIVVGSDQKFCSDCGSDLPALGSGSDANAAKGNDTSTDRAPESVDCEGCHTPLEPNAGYCVICGLKVPEPRVILTPERLPIAPPGSNSSAVADAGAGFLGALWGGSASCGCGCFSLIFIVGFLALLGAFL